ncbi:hypothetical protein P8452_19403 [Trifolium repens]|nr:hypothetical protein P8452_19403 [Trifolium repens]
MGIYFFLEYSTSSLKEPLSIQPNPPNIQIITNGIYPSIEHQATVNSEKERISLATFYGPNMQAILAPAPSLVTQERPAQFRKISVVDHFNGYFPQELRGKSYLNQMKITHSEE